MKKICIASVFFISLNFYAMDNSSNKKKKIEERTRHEQHNENVRIRDTIEYSTLARAMPREKSTPRTFEDFFWAFIEVPCFYKEAANALDMNKLFLGLKNHKSQSIRAIMAVFEGDINGKLENSNKTLPLYSILTSKLACSLYGALGVGTLWYLNFKYNFLKRLGV